MLLLWSMYNAWMVDRVTRPGDLIRQAYLLWVLPPTSAPRRRKFGTKPEEFRMPDQSKHEVCLSCLEGQVKPMDDLSLGVFACPLAGCHLWGTTWCP